MNLLTQPFDGQLGTHLLEALESDEYESLSVVVAFAKNSGVLRLRDSLQRFRDKGGELHFYVGVDMNGTSYEALSNLFSLATSLRVIHDENGQTFHTKLFNFTAKDRSRLIVGSHNLTGGGLWTNFESSISLELDRKIPLHRQIQQQADRYLQRLRQLPGTVKLLQSEVDIRDLLSGHYIEKEVRIQIRRRQSSSEVGSRNPLFTASRKAQALALPSSSAGSLTRPRHQPTSGPLLTGSDTAAELSAEESTSVGLLRSASSPTLWLETRKMTGGSRNILDLSKASLLRSGKVAGTSYAHQHGGFMQGAVEFFGVDPEDIDREKEIVVNFEGKDYVGNTIKFPKGKNANGTWRVQLKGVAGDGSKITSAFKQLGGGGHLLPQKVVTFTRVKDDYYFFSVFDKVDLAEFLEVSQVTAYNGAQKTAKHLGIL